MTHSPMSTEEYISRACEVELALHGDSHRGAGYTRTAAAARAQYALMLEVVREADGDVHILDFGCGLGHLLDYIQSQPELAHCRYTGLDLSDQFLGAARRRHPEATFLRMNVLEDDTELPEFDYAILNGVFNYRGDIPRAEMLQYWERLVSTIFRHCRRGMAFNVMSSIVDWERDDLFHLSFDEMAHVVGSSLSRHFVIRHDYPGYEYTTYVYREPWGAV